ncbi:endonuclease III-like protein 1 [Toxorhynchites rutilus septentrionalis]|uniref:endonuclease III-like protein 1 n=1 Tax=Toxorhynchites rutilus septentrionalis TaxID=329112 RepID=UPI00247A96E5|nr:endonuclease III-like protein 1 [Toxorhynchites rutilus septentrionalis]
METKSPYFSPKKTRNFVKQHQQNLHTTLLQKTVDQAKTSTSVASKLSRKGSAQDVPQIKIEPTLKRKTARPRKHVKIETNEDKLTPHHTAEKTPEKQRTVPLSPGKGSLVKIKQEPKTEECDDSKWEPNNWRLMLENIREMRQSKSAPVDTMGCDQFRNDDKVLPKTSRFYTLVSLMLSSQTKDQVNFECMQRLKKHGLTPEHVVATDTEVLEKLIYPVSFYKNKAKFIKQTAHILLNEHAGDIPDSLEGLLKLPGVGKKMAHLCMRSAWNVVTGIGVDTHVHRISNWLRWVPQETKTPEDTRVALEKWLPFELWEEVNQLMVGFGQTVCTSNYPRCDECLNADICPARGKHGIRRTPVKKEIKPEQLEF